MAISIEITDIAKGCPAVAVAAVLEIYLGEGDFEQVQFGETDAQGRIENLMPEDIGLEGLKPNQAITLRLTLDTGAYFDKQGVKAFYPYLPIIFHVNDLHTNTHLPVMIGPFGYSTHKGAVGSTSLENPLIAHSEPLSHGGHIHTEACSHHH
jgi:5-hydroxyisourate hydrolase